MAGLAAFRGIIKALVVVTLSAASCQAGILYSFVGTGLSIAGLGPEPVAFQLSTLGFVNPSFGGGFVLFACAQLDSSTNCDPAPFAGINFSNQSVLGAFSAQLTFDASNQAAYNFFFPTGAFGTPGVYNSDASNNRNPGTLTVTLTPEPASVLFALSGLCLCGLGRLRARFYR